MKSASIIGYTDGFLYVTHPTNEGMLCVLEPVYEKDYYRPPTVYQLIVYGEGIELWKTEVSCNQTILGLWDYIEKYVSSLEGPEDSWFDHWNLGTDIVNCNADEFSKFEKEIEKHEQNIPIAIWRLFKITDFAFMSDIEKWDVEYDHELCQEALDMFKHED